MDHFTLSIQRKISKVENSLLDLNSEIFTAIQYLVRLKENSSRIVRNLNSISTPANYLNDFMDVNSFILKYLGFLTEINCKFEMLEMSENAFANTISISKAINLGKMSGSLDKLKSEISSKSELDSKFNKSSNSKSVIVEQPSESEVSVSKKSLKGRKWKKKKSKNYQKQKYDNNKNKKIIDKLQISTEKLVNDSDTRTNATDFLETNTSFNSNDDLQDTLHLSSTDEIDDSNFDKTVSPSVSSISDQNNLIGSKDGSVEESCSSSRNYSSSFPSDKTELPEIQSPVEDKNIPERKFSYNSIQHSKCKSLNESNKLTENENENENENEVDEIKPANIIRKPGEEYDIAIEYIKSPSEFYVSFLENQSEFLELEKKLKSIPGNESQVTVKKTENKKAHLSQEIGTYALFYLKCDEMWCRAKVTNWCLNFMDDFVNIFLIDYGEYKCVSMDDLKPMPECFKQFCAFTQRCHLYGLIPLEMNLEDDGETFSWEKESIEKMKSLTEMSKVIRIKVAVQDGFHPLNSLPVTLWLVDQDNQCVNELLVKTKYAIQKFSFNDLPIKTETQDDCTEEIENLYNWNPMKEDYESYQNLYDLDVNDPATLIYGYVGKDYERVCPHFEKTGYCFKGQACKKEHKKLDPLGFTTDQEEIYKNAFNILSVPFPESVLIVQVTYVLSINQFFCIAENPNLTSSDEENLESLVKFINTEENVQKMKKLLVPPSTGQIVLARYSEDNSWYRGRILESEPEKDAYKVMFVDYGNKETLRLSEIRAVEARYLHLPFQAMHCSIFGIDRNPKISVKEISDYLDKKLYNDHICIEIVSRLPGEEVSLLVHVFDRNGKNIGQDLIDKNFAIFKEEMVISNHSSTMPG